MNRKLHLAILAIWFLIFEINLSVYGQSVTITRETTVVPAKEEVIVVRKGEPIIVHKAITTAGILVPEGTLVKIRLDQTLDSRTNRTGDSVAFTVVEPVYIGGTQVIKEGALAAAQIDKVRGPGPFGRNASLRIKPLFVLASNKREIPIALGPKATKTNESLGFAAGASAAGLIVFGPVGILGGGLVRGHHIDIPVGTVLMVEVSSDTLL